jgi:hypothetical protein
VRPTSPAALSTMLRARTAAELWSEPSDIGEPADAFFADHDAVASLLSRLPVRDRLFTDRDPAYLHWRYRFEPLRYRAVPIGDRPQDGVVVVRLRRRGPALECAVCDVLAPAGRSVRSVLSHIARASGAHYLLRCIGPAGARDGFLPAPQLGPVLTWKPICRTGVPGMGALGLTLGDVELF